METRSVRDPHAVPAADDWLAYATAKIIIIRDRRLGCLYWFLFIVILLYVVIFQILFCNEHYPRRDVSGTGRLEIQHPTKNLCDANLKTCDSDFVSLEQLEYCREFSGKTELRTSYQRPCVYADQNSMAPHGMLGSALLVPTLVESTTEAKGCEPSPANGHNCDNEYRLSDEKDDVFVADIEHYAVTISHTYTRITEAGTSNAVQGYYLECDKGEEAGGPDIYRTIYGKASIPCEGTVKRKPIECMVSNCPYLEGVHEFGPGAWLRKLKSVGTDFVARIPELLWSKKSKVERRNETSNRLARQEEGPASHDRQGNSSRLVRTSYVVGADGQVLPGENDDSKLSVPHAGATEPHSAASREEEEEEEHAIRDQRDGPHMQRSGLHGQHRHQQIGSLAREEFVVGSGGQISAENAIDLPHKGDGLPMASASQLGSVVATHSKGDEKQELAGPDREKLREGGAWAVRQGDVFTVAKLLELADLSLDVSKNEEGKTLREAGTVIEVEAVYSNLHPWTSSFGNTLVEYEYRVTRRPVEDMNIAMYSQFQPDFPAKRVLEHRHGLYIVVKIGGEFGNFSLVYLFVMLCTAAGLCRMASFIVDYMAIYCLRDRDYYAEAKYDYADRVNEDEKDASEPFLSQEGASASNQGPPQMNGSTQAAAPSVNC